ncbi:CUE domain-containing protein 2-like [Acanthaster planci]|uniref:CUE domain-containing protein 2-like n=1 Tax=Acanthaster planci TaxID=133434 RepID=A0A8B8A2D6_ACAPL|nr:CUE domain-containing protein 2-like [Acanthaster planci]
MSLRMERKGIVTSALDTFLKIHLPQSSIGAIDDDIVLNYLVGVLKEVGNEDEFDVEDFAEMMEAYIPSFRDIGSDAIYEWIFQLSAEVLLTACTEGTPPTSPSSVEEFMTTKEALIPPEEDIELPYSLPSEASSKQGEGSSSDVNKRGKKRETWKSATAMPPSRNMDDKIKLLADMFPDACKMRVKRCLSDVSGDVEQAVQVLLHQERPKMRGGSRTTANKIGKQESMTSDCEETIQQLREMFPSSTELQARQCLSIAKGDLEQASQVLLNLQESGKLEDQSSITPVVVQKSCVRNETNLKESVLEKYGYVDTDEDSKNHRPMEPKKEKKKMVRYINSQTVTTKGERFIETKKPESDEMKKTYCNLKPARKYHFH